MITHHTISGVLERIKSKIRPNRSLKRENSNSNSSDSGAHNMASEYEWSLVDEKRDDRIMRTGKSPAEPPTEDGSTGRDNEISETGSLKFIGGEELVYLEESNAEFIWHDERTKTWQFYNTFILEDHLSERSTEETDRESYHWINSYSGNREGMPEVVEGDIEREVQRRLSVLKNRLLGDRDKNNDQNSESCEEKSEMLFSGLDFDLKSFF